jgi:hypothetical protein
LRDPQHLETFLRVWSGYLDAFHSADYAEATTDAGDDGSIPNGAGEDA